MNETHFLPLLRASASRNFNSTLFYHSKKSLYHYTIPFYNISSIPNFYFTIQHIKIIFLRNKIIYSKTQIKTKTQITSTTAAATTTTKNIPKPKPMAMPPPHGNPRNLSPKTHGDHHHYGNPPPSPPWTHIWPIIKTPPPSTTTTATPNSTTMNPQKKNPFQNQIKPTANFESKRWPTKKKNSSQNLHKPNYKPISPLQTTPETHEHAATNHHTKPILLP